jgi:hypothetical protein
MVLGTPNHRRPTLNGGTGTAPVSRAMPLLPSTAHRQPVLKNLRMPQQLSLDLQPRLR